MDKEKAINDIIERFDFDKVHRVMKFLDWSWSMEGECEVPSMGKLFTSSQRRLYEIFDKCTNTKKDLITNSGGFVVFAKYNKGTKCCDYLELRFELTSAEYDEK